MLADRTPKCVTNSDTRQPKSGDVFGMQLPDQTFLFGRVVSTEAQWTLAVGASPALLVYIYRGRLTVAELPDRAVMRSDQLLVSPIRTNQQPWSKGYPKTLGQPALEPDDVLPQHCFLSASRGRYFDEHGNEPPGPVEPVGDYALHSFRTIDPG